VPCQTFCGTLSDLYKGRSEIENRNFKIIKIKNKKINHYEKN